jgi:hypothetical protein
MKKIFSANCFGGDVAGMFRNAMAVSCETMNGFFRVETSRHGALD